MSDEGPARPWEPRPGETPRAYAKFRRYLEQGPGRSIPKLAAELGMSESTLYDLSAKHEWRPRALAWDADIARRRDEVLLADREELLQRQLRRAKEADAVGRALTRMGLRPDDYAGELQLDPVECLRYGERYSRFATDLEDRLLAGEESEASSEGIADELFGLDDPALRRVIEEAKRAEQEQEEVKEDG